MIAQQRIDAVAVAVIFEGERADILIILDGVLRFIGIFQDRRQRQFGHFGAGLSRDTAGTLDRFLHRCACFLPQMGAGERDARA